MMRQWIEHRALALTYGFAIWVRTQLWRVLRPKTLGVRVLVVDGNTVLLIRHRSGSTPWSLPGGGVERYERLEETARREAREETGATVRVDGLLGMYDQFIDGLSNYVAVFVCTPLTNPDPPRSLEIAEARFFRFDEVPDTTDPASVRRIAEYRSGKMGVSALW